LSDFSCTSNEGGLVFFFHNRVIIELEVNSSTEVSQ